ncbi:glutamate--tRNA ligase [Rubripirellula sp.]|jgi:glutamyl-tRNA synthetase|nr:glutamate--tRNA ligase [Rubripirellula sp.]
MIRTRFAPSPTGYLHIGGVRTALFNWLLAKQSGGQFILRIDDTDSGRNVAEALQPILDGFRWLGLNWDEGPDVGGPHAPYYQSQRSQRYSDAVKQLLASGHAYRDFARPEELQQEREAAEKNGQRFFYDRRWAANSDEEAAAYKAEGRPQTIRLKMPREGECVIEDLIRGEVRFEWSKEQDTVIQRPDGSCLYHLASVVDDADFAITHVVRAEEHLPNTPRQIFIIESLGLTRPIYAHLPYVAEPGGSAKLSKRKLAKYEKNKDFADLLEKGRKIAERCGIETQADTFNPVIIDFYREIGFQPEAILNYLLLLGWSLDGEREKFSIDEMVELFTLERVNKAPASFDPRKLNAFQSRSFANLPIEDRLEAVIPFARSAGLLNHDGADQRLANVVKEADDRLTIAGDILDFDYCFIDEYEIDESAFDKRIRQDELAPKRLCGLADALADLECFDTASVEEAVQQFCASEEIKLRAIIHALRIAATGRTSGFGMFETLSILGKEKCIERLRNAAKSVDYT